MPFYLLKYLEPFFRVLQQQTEDVGLESSATFPAVSVGLMGNVPCPTDLPLSCPQPSGQEETLRGHLRPEHFPKKLCAPLIFVAQGWAARNKHRPRDNDLRLYQGGFGWKPGKIRSGDFCPALSQLPRAGWIPRPWKGLKATWMWHLRTGVCGGPGTALKGLFQPKYFCDFVIQPCPHRPCHCQQLSPTLCSWEASQAGKASSTSPSHTH